MKAIQSDQGAGSARLKMWPLIRAMAAAGVTSAVLGGCSLLDGNTNFGALNDPELNVRPLPLITRGDKSPDGYYALGKYYLYQGRLDQAKEAFWDAVRMDQNHVDALNGLGVVYDKLGQFDAARKVYETALLIDPTASHVWANLGYSLKLAGKDAESVAPLQRAIALDPANATAQQNLASVEIDIPASAAFQQSASREQIVIAEKTSQSAETTGELPVTNQLANNNAPDPVVQNSLQEAATLALVSSEKQASKAQPSTVRQSEQGVNLVNGRLQENLVTKTKPVIASVINQSHDNGGIILHQAPVSKIANQEKYALASSVSTGKPISVSTVRVATAASLSGEKVHGMLDDLKIEVSNGNGMNGMARAVGAEMSLKGLNVKRITNAKPFNKPQTLIMCRAELKSAAEELARSMPASPKIILSDVGHRRVDVRVVLGADTVIAWKDESKEPYLVASLAK